MQHWAKRLDEYPALSVFFGLTAPLKNVRNFELIQYPGFG
jgi:hypothetical protein